MQQTDTVWITAGRRAAVVAAPGYWGSWTDRVARAYIVAAQRAGADAVEVPCVAAPAMTRYAADHGLRVVAHVDTPADPELIARAAGAGVDVFHADTGALADGALAGALAGHPHCLLVSTASAPGGWPGESRVSGLCIIPLYSSATVAKRMQSPARPVGLFGCETIARQPVPAPVIGVLVAAAGAAVVRQHLALARYFGRDDAAHFLTHRDFREMVQNLRAAERIVTTGTVVTTGATTPRGKAAPARMRGERPAPPETAPTTEAPFTRLPADAVSITSASEVLKPAVHGRFFASELVAGVAATIDLTGCTGLRAALIEMLIARLKRARTLDSINALVKAGEPEGACATAAADAVAATETVAAIRRSGIECMNAGTSWLAGMLELAGALSADVLVWLPATHVLADPAIVDRMVVQHVKSNADYTFCRDLPAGLAPRLMSVAALRRIGTFTENHADAETAARLLSNRRVFRVQELLVEERLRRPDLDLTWGSGRDLLLRKIARTGAEAAAELIERADGELRGSPGLRENASVTLACKPLCLYTLVTHGDGPSASF
ncbi:MAG TPA: hypothetical protein VM186_10905 [Planctomycetota bacterium]|nr:hypothetical protein [Planctomycetota bacterium]